MFGRDPNCNSLNGSIIHVNSILLIKKTHNIPLMLSICNEFDQT